MINIPAMTPESVHKYLYEIGRRWKGQGMAIELGSWLGATAAALGHGLKEAGYDMPFYCYDRWIANSEEVEKAKLQGMKIKTGQNLLPIFLENVRPYYRDIRAFRGPITDQLRWNGEPIEICIFDAPKRNPTFAHAIRELSPCWIPGTTILGLLDIYFYREKGCKKREACMVQERFIKENKNSFSLLAQWPDQCDCAFFEYQGGNLTIPN